MSRFKPALSNDVNYKLTNIFDNGDFSNGVSSWIAGTNIPDFSVSDGVATFTGAGPSNANNANWIYQSKVLQSPPRTIYIAVDAKQNGDTGGTFYLAFSFRQSARTLTSDYVKHSFVETYLTGTNLRPNYSAGAGVNVSIRNAIAIDLTSVFGVGNEPSVDEMDYLLSKFPNSWFDGTKRFSVKEMLNMHLKEIHELKTAVVGLGGSV